MSWKTDLKLRDLEGSVALEVMCKRCGRARYEVQERLLRDHPEFRDAYLDEVEYSLHCAHRSCRGGVRVSLIHDGENEGFVGGMP